MLECIFLIHRRSAMARSEIRCRAVRKLATLPPAEQPRNSIETDPWGKTSNNLWREGYGVGNPNPQRIHTGQEPKDF